MTSASDFWIQAGQLFPGHGAPPLADQQIQISNGTIAAIEPASGRTHTAPPRYVDILAPGFIDIQINGAGGVLFNDQPNLAALKTISAAARLGGVCHILPTFITAAERCYEQAMQAVIDAAGLPGILGLHLEGPFLSPERPGIHDARFIRPIEIADIELLCSFEGRLLLTLAPEQTDKSTIKRLAEAGIILFAGHSAASIEEMAEAALNGLSGVTHLFNACSQLGARAPGIVGAALTNPRLFAGIIADGHHVHDANLQLAVSQMENRLCLVTDTMPSYGSERTDFMLAGQKITLKDGKLNSEAGQLAGAHLGMDEAVRNIMQRSSVRPEQALDMASAIPAKILGLESEYGKIDIGRPASLTCLDKEFHCCGVYVHGRPYGGIAA